MKRYLLMAAILLTTSCMTTSQKATDSDKSETISPTKSSKNIQNTQQKLENEKVGKTICVDYVRIPFRFLLTNAMRDWSQNGVVELEHDYKNREGCIAHVGVSGLKMPQYDGITEFYSQKIIVILIRKGAPHLRNLYCHELGHVLGLPHRPSTQSCMNHDARYPQPSPADLQWIRRNGWEYTKAKRSSCGC